MGDITVRGTADIISNIVLKGDLSGLTAAQRMDYYNRMCQHVGIDPVTQPFSLLNLSGKQVLYANKSATEQLRVIHGVSVSDLTAQKIDDIYVVVAKGVNKQGRTDAATGAVNVSGLKGDAMANAMMKAETKAKRRLTLSLCGLGMLDESEIETIPGAAMFELGAEPADDRKALMGRLAAIRDLLTEDERDIIRKTLPTLSTDLLAPYVDRWEKKVAKSAGAGVPDEQIPFEAKA